MKKRGVASIIVTVLIIVLNLMVISAVEVFSDNFVTINQPNPPGLNTNLWNVNVPAGSNLQVVTGNYPGQPGTASEKAGAVGWVLFSSSGTRYPLVTSKNSMRTTKHWSINFASVYSTPNPYGVGSQVFDECGRLIFQVWGGYNSYQVKFLNQNNQMEILPLPSECGGTGNDNVLPLFAIRWQVEKDDDQLIIKCTTTENWLKTITKTTSSTCLPGDSIHPKIQIGNSATVPNAYTWTSLYIADVRGDCYSEQEICDGWDNDCNEVIDDNIDVFCYTGSAETLNVGVCHEGQIACSQGLLGTDCIGEVTPIAENCDNLLDDDCDGIVNNGCGVQLSPPECEDEGTNWFFNSLKFPTATDCYRQNGKDADGNIEQTNCCPTDTTCVEQEDHTHICEAPVLEKELCRDFEEAECGEDKLTGELKIGKYTIENAFTESPRINFCGIHQYKDSDGSDCTDTTACYCEWRGEDEGCQANFDVESTCTADQEKCLTTITDWNEDTCAETGKMTYKWKAVWIKNGITQPDGSNPDCVYGERTIFCPEITTLPVFSWFSVVSVVGILALFYYFRLKKQ